MPDDILDQQGDNEVSPTSNQDTQVEPQTTGSEPQQSQQAEPQTPFHEHPRFKELIEERNTFRQQMEAMQRQIEEQRQPQPTPKEHPFKAKLREIDPAYAEYLEGLENSTKSVAELKSELDSMRNERLVTAYENSVSKLHTELKVPAEIQKFIKEDLDALALSGRLKDLKGVNDAYRAVHSKYTGLLDSTRRAERASYVQDKSKDSQSPQTQTKGKPAPTRDNQGRFAGGDRETMLAEISRKALVRSRAESDI